jgi:hypothetical protein
VEEARGLRGGELAPRSSPTPSPKVFSPHPPHSREKREPENALGAQRLSDPVAPVLVATVAEIRGGALGRGIPHDAGTGAKRRVVDATNNLGQTIVEPRAGGDGSLLHAGLLPGVRHDLDKDCITSSRSTRPTAWTAELDDTCRPVGATAWGAIARLRLAICRSLFSKAARLRSLASRRGDPRTCKLQASE